MSQLYINLTIDGGSGVGKGTLMNALSKKLSLQPIDSGAMYRIIAYILNEKQISSKDVNFEILNEFKFSYENNKLCFNGKHVEDFPIRTPIISQLTSKYAVEKKIREFVTIQTRKIMDNKGFIIDGRDAGSVIMPNAEIKIYIDCPIEIRAKRRLEDYKKQGILYTFEEVIKDMEERDHRDKTRDIDPLCVPKNALMINNDGTKTIDEIVLEIELLIKNKFNNSNN